MRASFHVLDWLPLILYGLFLVAAGFWSNGAAAEDYLIAGRRLSLPVFVATLVATWYGGILGAGEFVYTDGVSAWLANGVPYYLFGIAFALLLARRVRAGAADIYTIPDKLASAYDKKTSLLGALLAFVYASPSTYVLMAGTLLKLLFGWPLGAAMIAGVLFSTVYVFRGGFLSDVRVNTVQFALMFIGFIAAAAVCLYRYGTGAVLSPGALPAAHLHPLGGHSVYWMLAWWIIALTTITDPGFHQRCYAARTPRIACAGILAAVGCWFLFDALTTTTGLYARALRPNLADPMMAFPALADTVLGPGWKGLFYCGMLAPIMAAMVSYTFIAAMTIGRDLIWRLRGETTLSNVPAYARIGLAASALSAIWFAIEMPSVVEQWYVFGNLIVSGLLIPLLGAYSRSARWRAPAGFAFLSMLLGSGMALVCLVIGWGPGGYSDSRAPLGLPPMASGILVCAAVYLTGLVVGVHRRSANAARG